MYTVATCRHINIHPSPYRRDVIWSLSYKANDAKTMGSLLSFFFANFFATQIIGGAKELVVVLWLSGDIWYKQWGKSQLNCHFYFSYEFTTLNCILKSWHYLVKPRQALFDPGFAKSTKGSLKKLTCKNSWLVMDLSGHSQNCLSKFIRFYVTFRCPPY